MNRAVIEERIQAAIRPQLDECDRLLDYYLKDAPPEVWEPIAFQVGGQHMKSLDAALEAFMHVIESPTMTADLYWKHP